MTQFKPGDRVTHNPTGEERTLVAVYGSYVKFGGWPEYTVHMWFQQAPLHGHSGSPAIAR